MPFLSYFQPSYSSPEINQHIIYLPSSHCTTSVSVQQLHPQPANALHHLRLTPDGRDDNLNFIPKDTVKDPNIYDTLQQKLI